MVLGLGTLGVSGFRVLIGWSGIWGLWGLGAWGFLGFGSSECVGFPALSKGALSKVPTKAPLRVLNDFDFRL